MDARRLILGSLLAVAGAFSWGLPQATAVDRPPTPVEDDAALHDVQLQGARLAWAVGDQGVIWHSRDGGATWRLQESGVHCALRSVCFLTDQIGWAAGGGTTPFTGQSYGVVLHTTDGGETWNAVVPPPARGAGTALDRQAIGARVEPQQGAAQALSTSNSDIPHGAPNRPSALPRLTRIEFFSTDEGFAVGQGTDRQPSGVFFTADAGASWHALQGRSVGGWYAADFSGPGTGVVAGAQGRVALINVEQLVPPRVADLGPRGLRDVALDGPRSGWLVGDAGQVLRTNSGGLVWGAPPGPLPDGVRDTCDFRAVCCRGKAVWIAGAPGSVIWHSADGGTSWRRQLTGQSVPLAAIHFADKSRGCAVGALGSILRTSDGGQSWEAARGGDRRLSLLMVHGQLAQVSLWPIAALGAEAGYRSLVSVIAEGPPGPDLTLDGQPGDRLADATALAGGSGGQVDWQLPVLIPGLERDSERLVAEWNRRTEGRLGEVLAGGLVRQLRTWRPSVLVLDQPSTSDALSQLIHDAALRAVAQAGDPTSFLEHQELAGLEPWSVEKVYVRLPLGSTGHVHVDPHEYLPRRGQTIREAAAPGESLFATGTVRSGRREAYRLVRTRWDERQGASAGGGFFAGLQLAPGTEARRALAPLDEARLDRQQKLAERQRNFSALTERTLSDPRQAGQLIAQLGETVRGMSESQGALQLAELADRYREHGHWELAELTQLELVEKFPDHPAAQRAAQQLIQAWCSAEVAWRRLSRSATRQQQDRTDPSGAGELIVQAEARIARNRRAQERTIFDPDDEAPGEPENPVRALAPRVERAGYIVRKDLEQKLRIRQDQAIRMAADLERRAPQLAAAPHVQFPLAAVLRQRGAHARADEIYREFLQQGGEGRWSLPAGIEFWLLRPNAPPPGDALVTCWAAPQRPILDGDLSDSCWSAAEKIPLTGERPQEDGAERPLALLCRDGEYLYLAASLPRAAGARTDGPSTSPRRHDEDLSEFDRVTLSLDVDRDRVTHYSFTIDQRGRTSEACWHDRSWNPRWLVAANGDQSRWCCEAAIPLAELAPRPPESGAAWGLSVVRTIPAVGWECWPRTDGTPPAPAAFGLVRFD